MYRAHVRRKLEHIISKELPRDSKRELIERAGRASIGAAMGYTILCLMIIGIVMAFLAQVLDNLLK